MDKYKIEKWRQLRTMGKTRFILFNGVISWGVGTAIIWLILVSAFGSGEFGLRRLMIAVTVFPVLGYLIGLWNWKRSETLYQKATKRDDDDHTLSA